MHGSKDGLTGNIFTITNVIILRHLWTCEARSCGWGSCCYWSPVSFSRYCTPLDALLKKGLLFISSLRPLFKKRGFVVGFQKKSYTGNCSPVNVVRHNNTIPDICHFFTRAKFLENKIYTKKTRKLRQNTQKIANFFALLRQNTQ